MSGIVTVSVVIPTFDRPDLLERALRSVHDQTLAPLEIIVVDNGWQPASPGALSASTRLSRIEPGAGPSAARNHGARLAKGDMVVFLDDDDTWAPTYLESLVTHRGRTGAIVLAGELWRIKPGANPEPCKIMPADAEGQRAVFYTNPGFGGSNIAIDREAFLAMGGFDTRMRAAEDRDLAARLMDRKVRIVACRDATAYMHEDAATRSRTHSLAGDVAFIRKHWRAMRASELLKAFRRVVRLLVRRLTGW